MEHQEPELPKLFPPEVNTVQQVVVTLLYSAREVDPKMILELEIISEDLANITQATAKPVTKLLNYYAMNFEAITRYHASGMVLQNHSNASLLSDPKDKIITG